jgi:hypothetical protein
MDEAAAIASRGVAHHDLVPLLHVPGKRPPAEDLEVIWMGADGENANCLAP